jgi:hypothetical protein
MRSCQELTDDRKVHTKRAGTKPLEALARCGRLAAKARPGADKSAASGAPEGARRDLKRIADTIRFAPFGAPPPHALRGRKEV